MEIEREGGGYIPPAAQRMVEEAESKKLYLLTITTSEGAHYVMPPADDLDHLKLACEHLQEAFPEMGFIVEEIKDL